MTPEKINFIAMCDTVANRLDQAGYDGEAAIENLEEMVGLLNKYHGMIPTTESNALLEKLKAK
jgi:hypothetical protein